MLSSQPRCIYRRHQLSEVICQLRFPEILSINTTPPAQFQEMIRDDFPQYVAKKDNVAPKLVGTPGNFQVENQPQTINYTFVSADGHWKVNLTSKFISLSCNRYTCWEDFARQLDKPLAAFIQVYHPAYFERVGLRYMNFIDRTKLDLADTPYRELISPCYLGPLAYENVPEKAVSRSAIDTEFALAGGCKAKIHAGPGMVRNLRQQTPEHRFVFDLDLYTAGKLPASLSAGALQTLHGQSYAIFRGAITDTLHDALEPQL